MMEAITFFLLVFVLIVAAAVQLVCAHRSIPHESPGEALCRALGVRVESLEERVRKLEEAYAKETGEAEEINGTEAPA